MTAYKDPRSITTSYVRNGFGEVIQKVSPDKGTATYVRDARGLVTQETDDLAPNKLMNQSVNGTVTRSFSYNGAGYITSCNHPGDPLAFLYNKRNRSVSATRRVTRRGAR